MALLDTLSTEARLLLSCSRVKLDAVAKARLERALNDGVDWRFVRRQAVRQGIDALLHEHLVDYKHLVPDDVLKFLAARSTQNAFRSLRQIHELNSIITSLEEKGIAVIPFKGSMLAELIYGNAAYRTSGDIDILVRRSEMSRVKQHLLCEGYTSIREFDAVEEQRHLESQMGYEFHHPQKKVVVEVHWSFFSKIYSFDLSPAEVWQRHTTVPFAGGYVRAFDPQDLLIYLCTHGTKHRWAKISWVMDVAELLRRKPDIDWNAVYKVAHRVRCLRMLGLGIHLAKELLDAPLPDDVAQNAATSRSVRSMARQICARWMFKDPDAPADRNAVIFLFHWKEREHLRDRWPYLVHHIKLWFKPSERDRAVVELPRHLSFGYYFIRPVRLLLDRNLRNSR